MIEQLEIVRSVQESSGSKLPFPDGRRFVVFLANMVRSGNRRRISPTPIESSVAPIIPSSLSEEWYIDLADQHRLAAGTLIHLETGYRSDVNNQAAARRAEELKILADNCLREADTLLFEATDLRLHTGNR